MEDHLTIRYSLSVFCGAVDWHVCPIVHLEPDPVEQLYGTYHREASEETHVATDLERLGSSLILNKTELKITQHQSGKIEIKLDLG